MLVVHYKHILFVSSTDDEDTAIRQMCEDNEQFVLNSYSVDAIFC